MHSKADRVDWDSLKPCVKRTGELWKPRRIEMYIEDYGYASIEVNRVDELGIFTMILDAVEKSDTPV